MSWSLPPGCLQLSDGGEVDGGEKDDGKVSFKTQTVAGGSQGEETRLCSACCLVESVKKVTMRRKPWENNSTSSFFNR